jgi:hypothetical protein
MQGIMDAPLLKSSFRPSTLKSHVMSVCTTSANVNSWVRGRLLYELWRMTGTADTVFQHTSASMNFVPSR